MNIQYTLISLLLVAIGILQFDKHFVKWITNFSNTIRGVKTEITDGTFMFRRVAGLVTIIVGLLFLLKYAI